MEKLRDPAWYTNHLPTKHLKKASGAEPDEPNDQFPRAFRRALLALDLAEEYADKIDEVEIAMETSLLKEAGKGNREDENNETMFRDKVVKFGDVPVAWLWEWVRRNSTAPIDDETIQMIMRRGPRKFRSAISSVTGAE